jgi:crotonobetainyl-CoA:carnitine CoA-transferase CaiB-like acyl-CoA transferase
VGVAGASVVRRLRSKRANHYGTLAEQKAAERYGLTYEGVHGCMHDAETDDGTPVEVKAAMLNRASGREGRFRIFKAPHRRLVEESGLYVFVSYRAMGRGISVKKMRSVRASDLDVDFYGAGGHRGTKQVKILPKDVL